MSSTVDCSQIITPHNACSSRLWVKWQHVGRRVLSRTLLQVITGATDLNDRKKITTSHYPIMVNLTAKNFIQINDTFVDPMLYTATLLFYSFVIAVQDKFVSFNPRRLCGRICSSLDLWKATNAFGTFTWYTEWRYCCCLTPRCFGLPCTLVKMMRPVKR